MNGERLARVSLALDAVYCGLVGLLIIVLRARIGGLVRLPALLIGAIGAAIVGWAYVVLGQTARIDWRKGVKQTLSANVVVSVLLALGAALHPVRGARALLAFLALEVMSFAVAQGISLVRGRRRD
jgi:tetrahydromethanopterin S-methyltransferase subunit E